MTKKVEVAEVEVETEAQVDLDLTFKSLVRLETGREREQVY